jgi:hypothetical protein
VLDYGQPMRDEKVSQSEPQLKVFEQIHDLRLNRYVEGRDRFIANDEFRIERKRAGYTNALSLPA